MTARRRLWVVGVLGLLGGALALLAALHSAPARGWVRGRAIATLRDSGIEARIGELSYNAFTLRVRIMGLQLASTHRPDEPFFEADVVVVDLPWSWMLGGDAYVENIELERPQFLVQGGTAGTNLPQASGEDRGGAGENRGASGTDGGASGADGGPAAALPLLEHLAVEEATIAWNDGALDASLRLSQINLGWSRTDGAVPAGRLETGGPGLVRWGARSTPIDDLAASLSFDGNTLAVDQLSARTSFGALAGDVHIALAGDAPSIEADLIGDFDVAALAALFDIPRLPESGRLTATTRIDGPLAAPRARLEIAGESIAWSRLDVLAVELTSTVDQAGARIEWLRLTSADGVLEGGGFVPFGEDAGGNMDLAWTGVDAEALIGEIGADAVPGIDATLDGEMTASWRGIGFADPVVSGRSLVSAGAGAADRVALGGDIAFELDATSWSASLVDGRVDDVLFIDVNAGGAVNSEDFLASTLGGRASVVIDAAERATRRLAELGIGRLGAAADEDDAGSLVSGALRAGWELSGTLGQPRAVGEIAGTAVSLYAVAIGDVNAEIEIDRSQLVMRELRARPAEGTATAAVRLDFSSSALEGELRVDLPDVAGLLPATAEAWHPRGALGLAASLTGTTENLVAEIDFEGGPLDIAGQTIHRFVARGRWADGTLWVERFDLHQDGDATTPPGLLRGSASYRMDTGEHELRVNGESFQLRPLPPGLLGEAGVPMAASFGLQWESQGTRADPRIAATFDIAELDYGDTPFGPLVAELNLRDRSLRLDATSNLLASRAEATLDLDPWGDFDLSMTTEGLDLGRLRQHLGLATTDVDGSASFALQASGKLDDLPATRGTLELRALDASINGAPIRLAEAGLIALEAGELRADPIALRFGGADLRIGGRSGASNELQVNVRGDLADVADVVAAVSAFARATDAQPGDAPATSLDGLGIRGDVELGLALSGSLGEPRVSGVLNIADGELTIADLPTARDVRLAVRVRDGALEIDEASAVWQGATLSATGLVPLALLGEASPALATLGIPDDTRAARLAARVDAVTPEVLRPFLGAETIDLLSGTLSGRLDIEADELSLAAARGEIVLEQADLRAAGVDMGQRNPTRLLLADGAVSIAEFTWGGATGEIFLEGGVALEPSPELALAVRGELDLRMLRALLPGVATAGRAQLNIDVTGPVGEPDFSGTVTVADGELRIADPRLALTEVSGTLRVDRDRLVVEQLSGVANGGTISLVGDIDMSAGIPGAGTLSATVRNLALEPLRGLGTLIDADLVLDTGAPMTLRGDVILLHGEYRERLSATTGLLATLEQQQRRVAGGAGTPSALDDLRLDINIDSGEGGILVDNNLARLTTDLDLVLSGTVARPALGGRAELFEGGTIFLSGNRFRLEEGSIGFVDPESIEPDLDLTAKARISAYDVELVVSGTPATLDVALSSNPELDQSDLVSLIVTGRTLEEAGSMPTQVARDQVLGLITAELSDRAGRAIGLDSVRIERGGLEEDYRFDPSVIAPETDPGSRLTLYKRPSENLELIFSQSLKESGKFTWIVGYRFLRNFSVRWLLDDDNSRAYELSQDLGFGATAAVPLRSPAAGSGARALSERVRDVRMQGGQELDEARRRGSLRLRAGDAFDYFRWQDDRDSLERLYQESGYFETRVNARRETIDEDTDTLWLELSYDIEAGPRTDLRFEGRAFSSRVRGEMEQAWKQSVYDGFLVEELEAIARRDLADDGFMFPDVEVRIEPSPAGDGKSAIVRVEAGERSSNRRIEFRGNRNVADEELARTVADAGLEEQGWIDRAELERELTAVYQQRGMLDASVRIAEPELVGAALVLPILVEEGDIYRFAEIVLAGVIARDPSRVRAELSLARDDPFAFEAVDEARRAIEASYRSVGFAHPRVDTAVVLRPESGAADVTFTVDEGRRQVLAEVVVSGALRTRDGVIDKALRLAIGAPLDPSEVYNARQRLYQTGVFRRVEMVVVPVEEAAAAGGAGDEPVRLLVRLQERAPYRFRYGVRVTDESRPATESGRDFSLGFSSDLSNRNVFGHAMTAGVSLRYQTDFAAVRGFIGARSMFGLPVATNIYVTRSNEEVGSQDFLPFVADKTVLTVEQRVRPTSILGLAYSYNFERNHTFDRDADPDDPFAFDISVDIAVLRFSALLDTRDDIFNARRGWSHSSNIDYSVPSLGSDLRYVKYLMQQYYFHPLTDEIILASAVRMGLANSFEQELIPSERFFAGGGNSVRGYAEDSLGPQDFLGAPIGGEALLVLKQEIRFPIWRYFGGVGFFDAGNAFASVGDISFSDLATSWGFGVRVDTPFALLRADYGFPIGRQPGDPRGRFFFSIGQSF